MCLETILSNILLIIKQTVTNSNFRKLYKFKVTLMPAYFCK